METMVTPRLMRSLFRGSGYLAWEDRSFLS
jgi:hypothetical protein